MAAVLLTGCGSAEAGGAESSILRVGTCGDEPPFSKRVNDTYVGIDIDLAQDLGNALGREVEFVATSWSTLLSDLQTNRFDVAMSGINVTSDREAAAEFSRPYLRNGKQAVVRCSDAGRFATLDQVNRIGIRVLTNLGGSNSAFANRRLPNATTVRITSTTELYGRLTAGQGDILFTDAMEAQFRTEHDPVLCLGLGGTIFDDYPVAVLMQRDSPLRAAVDHWVAARERDGYIARVIEAHSGHY